MKSKRTSYIIAIAICVALILSMSCEMFTTSQLTMFKRDLSDSLKDLPKEDLLNTAADPTLRGDPEGTKQVLKLIGAQDLSDIKPEQANSILELATDAMLPVSALTSLSDSLIASDGNNSGSSSSPEVSDVISSIVKNVPKVDTEAVQKILTNDEYLKDPNTNLETVVMASVAVVAGSLANAGFEDQTKINTVIDELTQGIEAINTANPNDPTLSDKINDKIEEVLNNNGASEVSGSMQAALNALVTIQDNPNFTSTEIVGTSLDQLLSGLLG